MGVYAIDNMFPEDDITSARQQVTHRFWGIPPSRGPGFGLPELVRAYSWMTPQSRDPGPRDYGDRRTDLGFRLVGPQEIQAQRAI